LVEQVRMRSQADSGHFEHSLNWTIYFSNKFQLKLHFKYPNLRNRWESDHVLITFLTSNDLRNNIQSTDIVTGQPVHTRTRAHTQKHNENNICRGFAGKHILH
jgi:hypothetical protein